MPDYYVFATLEEVRRYRGLIRLAATGLHVTRYFEITRASLMDQIIADPKFWSEYTVYFSEENKCLYVEGNYN